MKLPARPHFFTQLSTLTKIPARLHWLKPKTSEPVPNQLWLQAQAETLAWQRNQTLEQEASYDEAWVNSAPKGEVDVRLLSAPPHISDLDTVAEMPVVSKIMSHIYDEPTKFASISGPLLATQVKDTRIITRIPTTALPKPAPHITDKLRMGNITDPYLPSVRMTPTEFAIVPRQSITTQLPPRLGDDTADAPEHVTPVDTLINQAIVTFHQEHQRLPHGITVSLIRFYQHWLDHHYSLFTYKAEYSKVQIPIRAGAKGELLINEVRLD